jgi:hypothetical protein
VYKLALSQERYTSKLQPGDPRWHDFNGGFRNVEIETVKLLDAIYYGHAMTTQHKNNWRTAENYLAGQHIGLDFDNEDETCTLATLAKDKFISKYAALIHTTISHTPEKPRARVVFLLDQPILQAKNYALAATALLWVFGTADRQCKDAVRFFYGAPGCDFDYLDNVLPLETVKTLITKYQESGQVERRKASTTSYNAPANQAEVASALRLIPPMQVSYDEWLALLMAVHSAFGEDGYSLAEGWAEGKPGEVGRKWKSFKSSGNNTGAVTISTVFGIAKRFGWHKGLVS